jgi:hypothetical protein
MGVMDIFISIIAKALHIQLKIKTKNYDLKSFKNYEQIKMADFTLDEKECITSGDFEKKINISPKKKCLLTSVCQTKEEVDCQQATTGRWFMQGPAISAKQAESMIILIKDILNVSVLQCIR